MSNKRIYLLVVFIIFWVFDAPIFPVIENSEVVTLVILALCSARCSATESLMRENYSVCVMCQQAQQVAVWTAGCGIGLFGFDRALTRIVQPAGLVKLFRRVKYCLYS